MSHFLQPHELQYARLLCPSLFPWVCSNSSPLSWWCHPTISSSVASFSSCPQSFQASWPFPMSRLFTAHGQSIRVSASVLAMNIQGWFPSGLTDLISLLSKGLSRLESSSAHSLKASILWCLTFFTVHLSHMYMTSGKTIAVTTWTFVGKVMSLLFNTLSRFCHSFPSKKQASFNFMAAATIHSDFGAQEEKICHSFHFFPLYLTWSDGTRCHDLSFLNVEF